MNQAKLYTRLIAVAKAQAPDERVPFAFEQRVMAHLQGRKALDVWALWSAGLWRAAASCVALALLLGAWSWFSPGNAGNSDLSQDLENTLLAVDQDVPSDLLR
jgi:hypothetical protein